jgi:hypothetical protein
LLEDLDSREDKLALVLEFVSQEVLRKTWFRGIRDRLFHYSPPSVN